MVLKETLGGKKKCAKNFERTWGRSNTQELLSTKEITFGNPRDLFRPPVWWPIWNVKFLTFAQRTPEPS